MTHPHALPPLKVSQKARDAAADLWRGYIGANPKSHTAKEIAAGNMDHHPVARAFARFERDLTAPSSAGDVELERYGIAWAGWDRPISKPMADGYWTPWHVAAAALASTATKLAEVEADNRVLTNSRDTSMRIAAKRDAESLVLAQRLAQAVGALRAVSAIRPSNWDDEDDLPQVVSWNLVDDVLKGTPDAD